MVRILLVADASLYLDIEKTYLRQTDSAISTSVSCRDALDLMTRESFDLVYLDASVPDMDGIECCRLMRRMPDLSRLPVVIVGAPELRERALTAGASEFIEKPISKDDFLRTARKLTPIHVREHLRLPVNLRVSFLHRDVPYVGFSKDVSRGGMFIKTAAPLPRGARVRLEFLLPDHRRTLTVETGAEVIQVVELPLPAGRSPGVGVRFLEMDPEQRTVLHEFLSRMGG